MRWVPARSWKTIPEEIIGVIPNSMSVPLLLAIIMRSQYRGSEVSEDTIPYNGIWLITKKIRSVKPVHISFWLNGTFVSGCWTSGRNGVKGLMRSRKRTAQRATCQPLSCPLDSLRKETPALIVGVLGQTHGHSSWRFILLNLTDVE